MKLNAALMYLALTLYLPLTSCYGNDYLSNLASPPATSSTIPKTESIQKTESPLSSVAAPSTSPGASSSDVSSKFVGGFPASQSLVEAGFDGSNMLSEEDRSVVNDSMFVKEVKNHPSSPFSSSEMILIAKRFLYHNQGIDQPSLLSPSFRFQGPVVGGDEGLTKEEFLKAVGGFDIKTAFPDIQPNFHHFRVDPFLPSRVFFTSTATGTHTGDFLGIPATYKTFSTPPQACSVELDDDGAVVKYTIGHVMDRSVGNTGGLGGIFGPLYAIGKPLPFPEARPWRASKRYRFVQFAGKWIGKFKEWNDGRMEGRENEMAEA